LKTTAKTLIGLISTALVLCVAPSFADGWPTGMETALGKAAPGDRSDEARRRCDDLMQRARQAMAENDLASADALTSQAEALGVEYGPFHRGDTPKRVRRDLERQQMTAGNAPRRPSEIFSPLSLRKNQATATDPFATQRGDASLAILPDAKSKAKAYLRNGREELKRGDLTAAAYWHRKAAELQATFGASEDSPTKLAAEIVRR
jgi:general secretion pathway protein D